MNTLTLTTARARVLAALRAHDAHAVAADVAEATSCEQLQEIGRNAMDFAAITDTHAAMIGLLAGALGAEHPDSADVYLTGLAAVLDADRPLRPWIITSDVGERTWQAEDHAHAAEQHQDAFPDEPVLGIRLADCDLVAAPDPAPDPAPAATARTDTHAAERPSSSPNLNDEDARLLRWAKDHGLRPGLGITDAYARAMIEDTLRDRDDLDSLDPELVEAHIIEQAEWLGERVSSVVVAFRTHDLEPIPTRSAA